MHKFPRHLFSMTFLVCLALTVPAEAQTRPTGKPVYQGAELKDLMLKVMNFQISVYGNTASINWQAAPFWTGVLAAHRATGDEAFYQAAKKWGDATKWKIGPRLFHADDTAVGQAYEEMYLREKQPQMIADLQSKLQQYFDKKTVTSQQVAHGPAEQPWSGRTVWWWCDSLFMAPPTLARMGAITGDKRYFELLDSMYFDTVDFLFDPAEGLFYRDDSYFFDKRKSPTGQKVFWGRGNGWVYGGLIRVLDYLPKDDPHRQRYIDLFKKMSDTIVKYQGEDGLWRASINEPTWISQPESSCTGFYTFGLLAGINRGYLDRGKYLPIALRGWDGLNSVLRDDGGVGYAQQVGAAPEAFSANSTKEYAQGAFLMAASELYSMKLER